MKYLGTLFFVCLISLFLQLPAKAAITNVQTAQGLGGITAMTASYGGATTSGNFLICIIQVISGNTVTVAPTGFTLATTATNVNGPTIYVYYYPNASPTTTITATQSGNNHYNIFLGEYNGLPSGATPDQTNTGTAASGTVTSPITTSVFPELVVSTIANGIGDGYSGPTQGFTLQQAANDGGTIGGVYMDSITGYGGTFAPTCTTPANDGGNSVTVSFQGLQVYNNSSAIQSQAILPRRTKCL